MAARALAVVVVLMLTGCPSPVGPEARDAAAAVEVDSGAAALPDAGPAVPATLTPTGAWKLSDGGTRALIISPAGRAEIGPAVGLELTLPAPLVDFRLRLLDGRDMVLESDDTFTASDAGIEASLRFLEPLKPGRDFALQLDAQLGTEVTDVNGRRYEDFEHRFHTEGEYVADPKPGRPVRKKPGKKK